MTFNRAVLGVFVAFLFVSGCSLKPDAGTDTELVVSINDYKITRDEFETEFKDSVYDAVDTPESRQNFLNALIDRKLILQYAQKEGFDKEKPFLKSIEKFWEQSLLKVVLDRKTIEIASQTPAAGWEAQRVAETKKMNDWMGELRKRARITVSDGALKHVVVQEGSR